MKRCGSLVFWWDCDLTVRCVCHAPHRGNHTDGLRWWDDAGLQVDGAPRRRAGGEARRAA